MATARWQSRVLGASILLGTSLMMAGTAHAVVSTTSPEGYKQRACVEKLLIADVQLRRTFVTNAAFLVRHQGLIAVTPDWVRAYRERVVPICGLPGESMWSNCTGGDSVFDKRSFVTDAFRITELLLMRSDRLLVGESKVTWVPGPITTR